MNSSFKKILVALDDSVDVLSEVFEEFINKTLRDITLVNTPGGYTPPLEVMEKLASLYKNKEDSDKLYEAIEENFDNYIDDIFDFITSGLWESNKVVPTLFVRDRRQDNKFRSKFITNIPIIVQFIANDQNRDDPGMERTDKMFSMGVDMVIIATKSKKIDNEFGLQYIGYTANIKKIPLIMFGKNSSKFTFPSDKEKLEVFRKIEMNSDEYKNKFTKSVKKMRNTYYNGIKERSTIKIIDDLGPSKRISVSKPKIQTKASKKRQHKKSKEETSPSQIVEVETYEESYD